MNSLLVLSCANTSGGSHPGKGTDAKEKTDLVSRCDLSCDEPREQENSNIKVENILDSDDEIQTKEERSAEGTYDEEEIKIKPKFE